MSHSKCRQRRMVRMAVLFVPLLAACRTPAMEMDFARTLDPRIDPKLDKPQIVHKFRGELKKLWLQALGRPEADLKRQAAEAIARAQKLGMAGLGETAFRLVEEMEASNAHPVVRLAAAQALIALNARESAPALIKFAQQGGFDSARVVEAALVQWRHERMIPVWLARLDQDPRKRGELFILAIQGLAGTHQTVAIPAILRLALDRKASQDVRLEAARALAILQSTGLEKEARPLANQSSLEGTFDRLVAATLLTRHHGPEAEALLFQLAGDQESAVALPAAQRLLDINPGKLQPLTSRLVHNADGGLREIAAKALVGYRTPDSVHQLGPLLNDPLLKIRVFVRENLIQLAETGSLREPVIDLAMQIISADRPGRALTLAAGLPAQVAKEAVHGDQPRALQQSLLILGTLRHKPAADQFIHLMDHSLPEVAVPAAWSLRRVAVPATAPVILKFVEEITDKTQRKLLPEDMTPTMKRLGIRFAQMDHMIEALGVMKYKPAAAVMKTYLPTPPPKRPGAPPPFSGRAAWQPSLREGAIWTLGQIFAGDPQADTVASLRNVMLDKVGFDQNPDEVIAQVAVAFGRMKAREEAQLLEEFYRSKSSGILTHYGCAWALEQIHGKPFPPFRTLPKVLEIWHDDWFLVPLDR